MRQRRVGVAHFILKEQAETAPRHDLWHQERDTGAKIALHDEGCWEGLGLDVLSQLGSKEWKISVWYPPCLEHS